MFYMYVIQSTKNNSYYIGSTQDLVRRFSEHNSGNSFSTRLYKPWKLIYYEAFTTRQLAFRREGSLKKRAKSWQELCKRLGIER